MLFTAIKPMLATFGDIKDLSLDNQIADVKWDGYRVLLHKKGKRVEVYSRTGHLLTKQFPEFQKAADSILADEAIIDGEGVTILNGWSVFEHFDHRARQSDPLKISVAQKRHPSSMVAFDLIYKDGVSYLKTPLIQRKQELDDIIKPSSIITTNAYFTDKDDIQNLYEFTKRKGWEGIMLKSADSYIHLGARPAGVWRKLKHTKESVFVIMGYKLRRPFEFIVGENRNGNWLPVGTVQFGITAANIREFMSIAPKIHGDRKKDVQWVEPRIFCRVKYLERTSQNALRITSFKGFSYQTAEEWV